MNSQTKPNTPVDLEVGYGRLVKNQTEFRARWGSHVKHALCLLGSFLLIFPIDPQHKEI